jgi:hypothetical protein
LLFLICHGQQPGQPSFHLYQHYGFALGSCLLTLIAYRSRQDALFLEPFRLADPDFSRGKSGQKRA